MNVLMNRSSCIIKAAFIMSASDAGPVSYADAYIKMKIERSKSGKAYHYGIV